MIDDTIPADLIEIGMRRVTGQDFERFVNALYPTLAGANFIPLGGTKDGGADAMLDQRLWTTPDERTFYQASIQDDFRDKIRHTISRLREFGRTVQSIVYITNKSITKLDTEEDALYNETGVHIRIRDGNYLAAHVNDSAATREAFRSHIGPHLEYLKRIGATQSLGPSKHVKSPAVFVFLRQEVERRDGKSSLTDSVVDSLVLWALEDTDPDPDSRKLMSESDIREKIEATFPFARPIVQSRLRTRLLEMSAKQREGGREIRHYQKDDKFCLPHGTRERIRNENAVEEALKLRILQGFYDRISASKPKLSEKECSSAADLALRALQLTFEREGLEFAAFLERGEESGGYASLPDSVDRALNDARIKPPKFNLYRSTILSALHTTLHNSSPDERLLLGKLSRTYSLLFGLQADPRLIAYFQEMAGDFYLYVGSDLLVRALSERYIRVEDQRVRTLLKMLASSRAKLVLTEPVLEEVMNHIRTTAIEFKNTFAGNERDITHEIASQSPKILIRAYFQARLSPAPGVAPPQGWAAFIGQFCHLDQVGKSSGIQDLRRTLQSMFDLTYVTRQELEALVADRQSRREVQELVEKLKEHKAVDELAENDALLALAVYGRRHQAREHTEVSEFGYKTWWLATETSILRFSRDLVNRRGARYMMRPEFVLNFIALAPSMREVRRAHEAVFPSLLGIRLANRVKQEVFRDMIDKIREAQSLEPGRREALISDYSDKLKSDFQRSYAHKVVSS